ncbi:hypothetical protein ACSZN3_03470 [Aeromonas hydrophila]|uniref:hypothetical protein n=2 Tax=Aeromonas hydrophila TaxID=644 RepID=UPI003EC93D6E
MKSDHEILSILKEWNKSSHSDLLDDLFMQRPSDDTQARHDSEWKDLLVFTLDDQESIDLALKKHEKIKTSFQSTNLLDNSCNNYDVYDLEEIGAFVAAIDTEQTQLINNKTAYSTSLNFPQKTYVNEIFETTWNELNIRDDLYIPIPHAPNLRRMEHNKQTDLLFRNFLSPFAGTYSYTRNLLTIEPSHQSDVQLNFELIDSLDINDTNNKKAITIEVDNKSTA